VIGNSGESDFEAYLRRQKETEPAFKDFDREYEEFKAANEKTDARFKEIEAFALRVYTPAGWREFLDKPQPVFGGRSASDLIGAGEYDAVMSALSADFEGAGF
jgi:hypothetical protein